MLPVVLVVAVTLGWLRTLLWLYDRATAHRRRESVPTGPASSGGAPTAHTTTSGREAAAAAMDALDEAGFATWLGVSPRSYRRYVEIGLAEVTTFVATALQDDDPSRPA